LREIAEKWYRRYPNNPIRLGYISKRQTLRGKGKRRRVYYPTHPPHGEHRYGYQIDIGLFLIGAKNQGLGDSGNEYNNSLHDYDLTQEFVTMLNNDPRVTKIIFNDPRITGS